MCQCVWSAIQWFAMKVRQLEVELGYVYHHSEAGRKMMDFAPFGGVH